VFLQQQIEETSYAKLIAPYDELQAWFLTCDFLASNAVPASCLVPPHALRQ